jgi:hypothetical protein
MSTSPRRTPTVRRGLAALAALALSGVAAPALAAGPPATAASTTTASGAAPRASRIASTVVHTCLDVSTTDPAHSFLDIYGNPCNGSAPQSFTFRPVAGAPAGTYQIGTSSPGSCVVKYRFGLRSATCSTTPNPAYDEWTLQPVGTSGHDYRMLVTSTVGSTYPGCVIVAPRPNGYPGPLFTVHICSGAADEVLRLAAGLA